MTAWFRDLNPVEGLRQDLSADMLAFVSASQARSRSLRKLRMALSICWSMTALLCLPVVEMVPPRSRMEVTTGMLAPMCGQCLWVYQRRAFCLLVKMYDLSGATAAPMLWSMQCVRLVALSMVAQ